MRIAIVVHRYTLETSPTVKGLCSYLVDQGHNVDIYLDDLIRDRTFSLNGVRIYRSVDPRLFSLFKLFPCVRNNRKRFNDLTRWFSLVKLRRVREEYDWIFCVEIFSLDVIASLGVDLSRVSLLSLESAQTISAFKNRMDYVRNLISGCAFCIIQSPERGKDLENYLGMEIEFEYLPVSLRPRTLKAQQSNHDSKANYPIRIVYSGYFAAWAQLVEFLEVFSRSSLEEVSSLVLHGHHMGTDTYLDKVASMASSLKNVSISTSFYRDEQYANFLDGFDIGLALYKGPEHDPEIGSNWKNLIFSSGKIASYLWSGLAVLTNIDSSSSHNPPFLYIKWPSEDGLRQALQQYSRNRELYRVSAIDWARQYYNMDVFMGEIVKRIA